MHEHFRDKSELESTEGSIRITREQDRHLENVENTILFSVISAFCATYASSNTS